MKFIALKVIIYYDLYIICQKFFDQPKNRKVSLKDNFHLSKYVKYQKKGYFLKLKTDVPPDILFWGREREGGSDVFDATIYIFQNEMSFTLE